MRFALVGNPNCGKTTLFNKMTGSKQRVSNFPGVTIEKNEGYLLKRKDLIVFDMPGLYSLAAYTKDEKKVVEFLQKENIDCIINVVDSTNFVRSLYFTMQLLEKKIPVVLALNMLDELANNSTKIDTIKLSEILGIPVIPVIALKNKGVDKLVKESLKVADGKIITNSPQIIELIEKIDEINNNTDPKADIDVLLADTRYDFISEIFDSVSENTGEAKKKSLQNKIDKILTNKYLSIPIFFVIMLLVFWLTFDIVGPFFSYFLDIFINFITNLTDNFLSNININETLHMFIIEGVFAGVGSVLSFLPTIVVMFGFLSLLEDSGYISRVSFVLDKALLKIGISGSALIPLLIGFGCSVPAIMATRALSSERDRKITMMLVPFMSCSAKLPIYAMFTAVFFNENKALAMMGIYLLGVLVAIIYGVALKNTIFKGSATPFLMELPPYRFPTLQAVLIHMWYKSMDFIKKAFTVILIASILIWIMQTFDFSLQIVENREDSILAIIGKLIAPIFIPLGFYDWRAATALVTGLSAKEAVVSTLAVLLATSDGASFESSLASIFTPLSAFSFMVFSLLYMPCVAAMAAVSRELNSWKGAVLVMLAQTVTAWIVACIIYQIGSIIIK